MKLGGEAGMKRLVFGELDVHLSGSFQMTEC